ncbi:HK97-gp10 family putative phage morphogenesis protein [Paraburkholderia sp. EG287A]|uniref:HK97-gp10 family putative phage morphogenesis protein n=1 Tax=unclassified Paraburkholderia TaxID=2615204 RepID=UPI0034D1A5E6
MNFSFDVRGLAEMERFLTTLPEEVERKMLYGALMGAAFPILEQARENVRRNFGTSVRYTGTLERALVRGRNRRTKFAARVDIKIRRPRQKGKRTMRGTSGTPVLKPFGDDAFYARFLEFGTSRMIARPFLRPAVNAKTAVATERFARTLRKRMEAYCKRNGVTYRPF